MITLRIPAPPPGLASNVIGIVGLVAVALALGGLTGNWWWSVLLGGAFSVGLAYLAQAHGEPAAATPAPTPSLISLPRVAAVGQTPGGLA